MPLLTKDQGEALAKALVNELTPSVPTVFWVKTKQVCELLDWPPTCSELAFYEKEGQDVPKTILEEKDIPLYLFCISHCDYVLKSGTDIDHGTPFAEMYKRQTILINLVTPHHVIPKPCNGEGSPIIENRLNIGDPSSRVKGLGMTWGASMLNVNKKIRQRP